MVKVREEYPVQDSGEVDIAAWLDHIQTQYKLSIKRPELLLAACELACSAEREAVSREIEWAPGSNSFHTGLEMAEILAELHLDDESLAAAVIYRAVREGKVSIKKVSSVLGKDIAKLLDGVLRMAAIAYIRDHHQDGVLGKSADKQIDSIKKMLISIVEDLRVPLIKLAERTCAIRAVKNASEEKKRRVAEEVQTVYAPLANRLGIAHLKWELEDLSFRYLEPDAYKMIARLLDERRVDRDGYIQHVIDIILELLEIKGIKAEIYGRSKHIYSIWRKMKRKSIGFSDVYDIRAVRILVDSVAECYESLGLVHSLWRNIPQEFDDYIANPKENGYQSLHTAVIGPEAKVLEVQIRTHDFHEAAEFGVCSHWRYKDVDNLQTSTSYEQKIEWLRQVLELPEETGGIDNIAEQFSTAIAEDRVYAFTPDGHVVDLPAGSTPLDFAYHIHTDVGHKCRSAQVNGKVVPLTYWLQTGDQVEILTAKLGTPSRHWLVSELGYLKTARAKNKVRQWFKQRKNKEQIADGRSLIESEFHRLALDYIDNQELLVRLGITSLDDLYAMVGAGDLSLERLLHAAQAIINQQDSLTQLSFSLSERAEVKRSTMNVDIVGAGNMALEIADCCQPLPGDSIGGCITEDNKVEVHLHRCEQLLQASGSGRLIRLEWGVSERDTFPVDVTIEAYDRKGLLKDVVNILDSSEVNVMATSTASDKESNTATMEMTVEVQGLAELSRLLMQFNELPNVANAYRNG